MVFFLQVVVAIIFLIVDKSLLAGYSFGMMLLLVVIFSIFSQFGDLVESAIKRHFGVKDSGKIIPGHGGILDRFDGMIFVFPIMHFFWPILRRSYEGILAFILFWCHCGCP